MNHADDQDCGYGMNMNPRESEQRSYSSGDQIVVRKEY